MITQEPIPLLVICGPTAGGKTDLALHLADYYPIEIVCADSRQVYRYMDIGTAKVTIQEQAAIPHHLLDVVTPEQKFSVAEFTQLAHQAIETIAQRGRLAVVVGGTGLYIRALTEGLIDAPPENAELRKTYLEQEAQQPGILYRRLHRVDCDLARVVHKNDITRIVRGLEVYATTGTCLSQLQLEHGFKQNRYRVLKLAPDVERKLLYARIDKRAEVMVASGLLAETEKLLDMGYMPKLKSMRTIGYRQAVAHLLEGVALADAIAWMQRDTRRYAKRQLTWFRKDKTIKWIDDNTNFADIVELIDKFNLMQSKGAGSYGKNTI